MCNKAVRRKPYTLRHVPDRCKTQEMCNEAIHTKPLLLVYVPDRFKTQEMCNEIMRTMPEAFHRIPDRFKTQKVCDEAFEEDFFSLKFLFLIGLWGHSKYICGMMTITMMMVVIGMMMIMKFGQK